MLILKCTILTCYSFGKYAILSQVMISDNTTVTYRISLVSWRTTQNVIALNIIVYPAYMGESIIIDTPHPPLNN